MPSFSKTLSSRDGTYEAVFTVDERLEVGVPVVTMIMHMKNGLLQDNVSLWQLVLTPDAVKSHLEDQVGIYDVPMKESLILKALDGPVRLLESSSPIQTWTDLPNSISLSLTYNIGTVRLEGELPLRLVEKSLSLEVFHMMMTLYKSSSSSLQSSKIDYSLGEAAKDSILQSSGEPSQDFPPHTLSQDPLPSSSAAPKKRKVVGGVKIFAGSRAKK